MKPFTVKESAMQHKPVPPPVFNRLQVQSEIDRLWAEHKNWQAAQVVRYPTLRVLQAVASAHGLSVDDIRSARRTRRYAAARHHAVWELRRRRQDLGHQQIAAEVNRMDHTTAVHSYQVFCKAVLANLYANERVTVAKLLGDE